MKVLVVFAHPRRASFTGALLDQFISGLLEAGHNAEIVDLYREGFNPCLGEEDFAQFNEGGVMPLDVLREQARVEAADALGFVFPVWWWTFPAILKGWIDRVWSQGWAYDFTLEKTTGLLRKHKAVLLCNGGTSHQTYCKYGYYGAMQRQLDTGIMRYCGIEQTAIYIFPGVDNLKDARPAYLAKAKEIGRCFGECEAYPIGILP
jgi:NAD(P)H dehydrogenase (quinone)